MSSVYAGVRVVGDVIGDGGGRRSCIVTSYQIRIIEIPKTRVYYEKSMSICAKSGHRKEGHFYAFSVLKSYVELWYIIGGGKIPPLGD